MALITCKDCDKEISSNAIACPGCGAPTKAGLAAAEGSYAIFGWAAVACGFAAIFLPFFASVFFTPLAIGLSIYAFNKDQLWVGAFAFCLGFIGAMGLINTSSQMGSIQKSFYQSR